MKLCTNHGIIPSRNYCLENKKKSLSHGVLFILNCPFPEHHMRLHNVQMQRCGPIQIAHNVNEDGWQRLKNIHLQGKEEERAAVFTISTLIFFFFFCLDNIQSNDGDLNNRALGKVL